MAPPKKKRVIPEKKNNYFGGATCVVCLSSKNCDVRIRGNKPLARKITVIEPSYADDKRTVVLIPAGVHTVHIACEESLISDGVKYEQVRYKPRNTWQHGKRPIPPTESSIPSGVQEGVRGPEGGTPTVSDSGGLHVGGTIRLLEHLRDVIVQVQRRSVVDIKQQDKRGEEG